MHHFLLLIEYRREKKEQNLLFFKEKVYICNRIADIKKIYQYEERKEFFRN